VQPPLLQAFPFPSTLGEVVLYLPSLAGLFVYRSHGKCSFPRSSGTLLKTLLQAFPLQGCWAGATTSAFSGWLVYLQFHGGLPLPPFSAQGAPPSLLHVLFFLLLFIIQFVFFSLFSLGGGQSVQGAMLIWPRVVCGSTACCLAHLLICISQAGRSWRLAVQEPSWFLHLMWSGDAMCGLGVWRSQSFTSSWWFFL
jgi:hypothetical protein